ncbi:DNA glycosylase AlkZ-like family protein [Streptosporangium canum]|uniref:DNA glycosylase AlkZ-like family protein n=1 Tax=Streptosporangium canum TaxID=324952 RepID=UPI003684FF6D
MADRSSPATVESHVLGPREADRLWNWVLARQGLAPHTRHGSVEAIAEATLGLHAARLPSPFATVAARASQPAVALSLFDAEVRTRLITVRCMRKTLHSLPLELASAAHAATLRFRERDALRAVINAGVGDSVITAATAAMCELLGESGPLFHRVIETRLAATGIPVPTTRLALKLAWERGILAYQNQSGGWNREVRTFALTADAYPGLNIGLASDLAAERLFTVYLDRYGPVSLRDATWWSALSRMAVAEAWQRAGVKLVELITPWTPSPLYMLAERFAEYAAAHDDDCATGVGFLAHEDVALKAYFETRRRYLGDLPPSSAFNQIGEVLPTIVLDGRVVGTWAWQERSARLRHQLIPRMVAAERQPNIRAAAAALTATLRRGLHRAPDKRAQTGQLTLMPTG